jgi:hypothetical protein
VPQLLRRPGRQGARGRRCIAALELRDLAGYMATWDGGAYIKVVLEGKKEDGTEIHTVNRKALEIDSRDDAKTWFYAFLYGAGDEKLGLILIKVRGRPHASAAAAARAAFLKNLPALGRLVNEVQSKAANAEVPHGLDGRRLHVRSQHSALNTLLQSAGAVQMKKALVILDTALQANEPATRRRLRVRRQRPRRVANRNHKELADVIGGSCRGDQAAGEFFKFPCALDGEYKVGALGPRLIDVVHRAWAGGFTVQSDFARAHAPLVAMAASCGFITTLCGSIHDEQQFSTTWRVTREGLALLWRHMQ